MRDERGSGPDHMCDPPDPFGDDDEEDGGSLNNTLHISSYLFSFHFLFGSSFGTVRPRPSGRTPPKLRHPFLTGRTITLLSHVCTTAEMDESTRSSTFCSPLVPSCTCDAIVGS